MDENSARKLCLSPDIAQQYSGDWPLVQHISDSEIYLRSVDFTSITSISKAASVSGCVNKNAGLHNPNISDLVTYTAEMKYKGQLLHITTRIAGHVVTSDVNGGDGAAIGNVVCYADDNNTTRGYRCNILAKPAEVVLLTKSDSQKRGLVGGGAMYLGNIDSSPRAQLPGLMMLMSRRDLAADSSLNWTTDTYNAGEYGLDLPPGYEYTNERPQLAITRADAWHINRVCSEQVVLQQSVVSEALGGATVICRQWGSLQVYTNFGFPYYFDENSAECSETNVTVPFAVITISGRGKVNTAEIAMTIFDGSDESLLSAPNSIYKTITCRFDDHRAGCDKVRVVRTILSNVPPPDETPFQHLKQTDLEWEFDGMKCVWGQGNIVSDPYNQILNLLTMSEDTANFQMIYARELTSRTQGVVRTLRDPELAPCKVVPYIDAPPDVTGTRDIYLGGLVSFSVAYSFSYTFNTENKQQFDSMANDLIAQQSSADWGIVLTTCLATVVASLAAPAEVPGDRAHSWKFGYRVAIAMFGIVIEGAAGSSAAMLGIINLYVAKGTSLAWHNSDSGGTETYNLSELRARTMVTLSAQMTSRVPRYDLKLRLLIMAVTLGLIILITRWFVSLYSTSKYSGVLRLCDTNERSILYACQQPE